MITNTEAKARIKHVYRQLRKQGYSLLDIYEIHEATIKELTDEIITN